MKNTLTLEIKGKEIKLSLAEAKDLHGELDSLFRKVIPDPLPIATLYKNNSLNEQVRASPQPPTYNY